MLNELVITSSLSWPGMNKINTNHVNQFQQCISLEVLDGNFCRELFEYCAFIEANLDVPLV